MLIHWLPLLYGLFFGLIPPMLLVNGNCRYLRFEPLWRQVMTPRKLKQRRRRWWKLPLVWIDPVRGYFVAAMLREAFTAVPTPVGIQKILPLVATALVLFAVLCVQTSGRRQHGETISPSGFLAGMMLALLPLVVALSAIVIGFSTAIAMSRFAAGYLVAALATAGIGYFFVGCHLSLIVYTVLVATPFLLSWMGRSSLVIPVRC